MADAASDFIEPPPPRANVLEQASGAQLPAMSSGVFGQRLSINGTASQDADAGLSFTPPRWDMPTRLPAESQSQFAAAPQQQTPGPPVDLDAMILAREGSKDDSIGKAGEVGRGQILPSTAIPLLFPGADPNDPMMQERAKKALLDPTVNAQTRHELQRQYWDRYKDVTGVLIAWNAGPAVADKWLASGKDLSVIPASTRENYLGQTGGEWLHTPQSTPELQAWQTIAREEVDRLEKMRTTPPEGHSARMKAVAEGRDNIKRITDHYFETMAHPPQMKPVDVMQRMGSTAMILAAIGGLFARAPLTASLNAMGAGLEALNKNDWKVFETQRENWKLMADLGLKHIGLLRDQINDILTDDNRSYDHKKAEIDIIEKEAGITLQPFMESAKLAQQMQHWQMQMDMMTKRSQMQPGSAGEAETQRMTAADDKKWLADHPEAGGVPDEVHWKHYNERKGQLTQETHPSHTLAGITAKAYHDKVVTETGHTPTYDDWLKFSQENAGFATGRLSEDAVKLMAQQYEMGDTQVITSLPRGGPARIQVENQIAQDMKNLDDGARQIVMNRLRIAEARAAATTAGRVTMNTEVYSQEAKDAGKEVIRTSNLFSRTGVPKVNAAIAAFERNTGDPRIIQFGIAVNALRNAYGKLSNPTGIGVHDADKARFAEILDTSLSKGQIAAGVAQIIREGEIVSNAARKAQEEVLGRIAPHAPAGGNEGAVSPTKYTGKTQEEAMRPATPAEVDKIETGIYYIDPRDPAHIRQK